MMRIYHPPGERDAVRFLAGQFELVESMERPANVAGFHLWWHDDRLALYRGDDPHGVCLAPGAFERRASFRGALARACGLTAGHTLTVLDAMAGLGVDGMTLSALGCQVVMIEREPALWALLTTFVDAYQPSGVTVIEADAWSWLEVADRCFDVVYLDPLFPARRKGAMPGKAMQFLAELTPRDPHPVAEWIDHARAHAVHRLVLKRRLRDAVVGSPDWQIKGRSVRYDVYRGVQG